MLRSLATLTVASALVAAEPALLGLGVGMYDIDPFRPQTWDQDNRNNRRGAAGMIEYRPSFDLAGRDGNGVAVRGLAGVQRSENGATITYGGAWVDAAAGPVFIGASFGPAYWTRGESKELYSAWEFRSMIEVGWRCPGGLRAAATCSHVSNGGMAERNPGANTLGIMVLLPL